MTLEERLEKNPPANSKANTKGGDKTLIEADGGLDLSKNEAALFKARGGKLNTKPYSDTIK
jgi:hypothetical protein